jgi:mono/diheme cytochrome c family protein
VVDGTAGGAAMALSARRMARLGGAVARLAALVALAGGCNEEALQPPAERDGGPGASVAGSASAAGGKPRDGGSEKTASDGGARSSAADASLTFARDGGSEKAVSLKDILARIEPVTFRAFDPYYQRPKSWRAVPLADVIRLGIAAQPGEKLEELDWVLRASDGYTVPLPGSKVFEPGAYLAFEDTEVPDWEPIGPQRANPAPFYVVWREANQQSLETHPRPWQLARIEISPFAKTFPHTVPAGAPPDSAVGRGFRIFREQCILCHAINREGGRVGPDLNVPQSIVEYRPEKQIRQYVRDPRFFRYSTMPAHPNMRDGDIDDLLAYFHAMKGQKHDPGAADGGAH